MPSGQNIEDIIVTLEDSEHAHVFAITSQTCFPSSNASNKNQGRDQNSCQLMIITIIIRIICMSTGDPLEYVK